MRRALLVLAILVGLAAPGRCDVVWQDTAGHAVRLASLQQQGPVVLVFFKTWCSTSARAVQRFEIFQTWYAARNPRFHYVAVGANSLPEIRSFVAQYKITATTVEDPAPFKASRDLGARATPTLVLLDANGRRLALVSSWDRDAVNRLARKVAELTGVPYKPVSTPGDGMSAEVPG